MTGDMVLAMAAFGGVSSLVGLAFLLFGSHNRQIDVRLSAASRPTPVREPPWSGAGGPGQARAKIMPERKGKVESAQARLLHAGFYRQYSSATFFALRFLAAGGAGLRRPGFERGRDVALA